MERFSQIVGKGRYSLSFLATTLISFIPSTLIFLYYIGGFQRKRQKKRKTVREPLHYTTATPTVKFMLFFLSIQVTVFFCICPRGSQLHHILHRPFVNLFTHPNHCVCLHFLLGCPPPPTNTSPPLFFRLRKSKSHINPMSFQSYFAN